MPNGFRSNLNTSPDFIGRLLNGGNDIGRDGNTPDVSVNVSGHAGRLQRKHGGENCDLRCVDPYLTDVPSITSMFGLSSHAAILGSTFQQAHRG